MPPAVRSSLDSRRTTTRSPRGCSFRSVFFLATGFSLVMVAIRSNSSKASKWTVGKQNGCQKGATSPRVAPTRQAARQRRLFGREELIGGYLRLFYWGHIFHSSHWLAGAGE